MGKVAIEGMAFYAHHGYYENERKIGGTYIVDVYMETDFEIAAKEDELTGTINYEIVFEISKQQMEKSCKLIEHLAYKILTELMAQLTNLNDVMVRVSKINPPLIGQVARTYVELSSKDVGS